MKYTARSYRAFRVSTMGDMGEASGLLYAPTIRRTMLVVLVMTGLMSACGPLAAQQAVLPSAQMTALDGHTVSLPRDLSAATVIIAGFSRGYADATTVWEIPVRNKFVSGAVGFYDVAVLASVPGLLHGWVTRSIRSKVPPVLQPRFLPVFADEAGWKQVCGFDAKAVDAPYVVLVDRRGHVLWRTHEPYSEERLREVVEHISTLSK